MAKRFLRMTALIGLVFALVFTTACQQPAASNGVPDSKTIETYESLYGKPIEDVEATLKLSESDYTADEGHPERLILNEKQKLGGKEFTELLMFTIGQEPKTFLGIGYTLQENDMEELASVTETLLKDLKSAYGEMSTYPGSGNRISAEGTMEQIKKGVQNNWQENWNVGKNTQVTLQVSILQNGGMVTLSYQQTSENNN